LSDINPLLFYMNTSDYEEINRKLELIPCSKFITNYLPYPFPHDLARDFFLEHTEFSHLIVMPQDLEPPTPEEFKQLMQIVHLGDYDVLSCVCNVERPGHKDFYKWAICKELPSLDKTKRKYNWFPSTDEKLGVVKVEFQGMVFAVIARRIIERKMIDGEYVFKGTMHRDNNQFSAAPDLTFCHACKKLGIDIHANTDIRLKHYANHKPTKVGKEQGSTKFIKYEDNQRHGKIKVW